MDLFLKDTSTALDKMDFRKIPHKALDKNSPFSKRYLKKHWMKLISKNTSKSTR